MPDPDALSLMESMTAYAERHSLDDLLDLLAGFYAAYAPLSNDPAIKIVCDMAEIEEEIERLTVQ